MLSVSDTVGKQGSLIPPLPKEGAKRAMGNSAGGDTGEPQSIARVTVAVSCTAWTCRLADSDRKPLGHQTLGTSFASPYAHPASRNTCPPNQRAVLPP